MNGNELLLLLAALLIGTVGYALIVSRRESARRQWRAMLRRIFPHQT